MRAGAFDDRCHVMGGTRQRCVRGEWHARSKSPRLRTRVRFVLHGSRSAGPRSRGGCPPRPRSTALRALRYCHVTAACRQHAQPGLEGPLPHVPHHRVKSSACGLRCCVRVHAAPDVSRSCSSPHHHTSESSVLGLILGFGNAHAASSRRLAPAHGGGAVAARDWSRRSQRRCCERSLARTHCAVRPHGLARAAPHLCASSTLAILILWRPRWWSSPLVQPRAASVLAALRLV